MLKSYFLQIFWFFGLHCFKFTQRSVVCNLLRVSFLTHHSAAAAKSLQSCLTLCDPIVGSPPGSPVPGILQARTLEWAAISFSNVWKWKVKVKSLSRVWLLVTPWTAAYQAPPSMGFSRKSTRVECHYHPRIQEIFQLHKALSLPICPKSNLTIAASLQSRPLKASFIQ